MINKIELYIEDEDQAKTMADEMRHRGIVVVGPYYSSGYGAPINYHRKAKNQPDADYPDGDEG